MNTPTCPPPSSIEACTVLIAEDEPIARDTLATLVAEDASAQVVGLATNGLEAVQLIRQLRPAVVLLDIKMPGLDGLEVLRQIPAGERPVIIFTTAFENYAVNAFEFCALDYVLKPFRAERLHAALDRAKALLRTRDRADLHGRLDQLLAHYAPPRPRYASAEQKARIGPHRKLAFKADGEFHFLDYREIKWIEGQGDYLKIHARHASFLLRETFKNMEEQLDPAIFVRIHKSAMVNAEWITKVTRLVHSDDTVTLQDGIELRASRSYRKRLQEVMEFRWRV